MDEASTLWGPELTEYISSYNVEASLQNPLWSTETGVQLRALGLPSIRLICDLVGNKTGSDLNAVARQMPLVTLHTVLDLALFPQTLPELASPPLISACIRLMSAVKRSGRPSPFSFEFGYVCFRIILYALGVCLLKRANDLDATLREITSRRNLPPFQIFSSRLSDIVQDEIESVSGRAHCDWVLGWGPLKNRTSLEPLVPRSVAAILFDLLWEDRKYFFRALVSTVTPGLTGVLFLVWRYWRLERAPYAGNDTDSLSRVVSPICEILRRCILVAATNQASPILLMYRDIENDAKHWRSEFIDLEDCRTVVSAFNRRLKRTGQYAYAPLYHSTIPMLLVFVTEYVKHGAKDLLPSLFGLIVRHMWDWSVEQPERVDGVFIDSVQNTMLCFSEVLKRVDGVPSNVAVGLIDSVIDNDLLGLVVRMMTLMKPSIGGPAGNEPGRITVFGKHVEMFYYTLGSLVSKELVRTKFHDSFQDWLKYRMFCHRRVGVTRMSDNEKRHWFLCCETLGNILVVMRQQEQVHLLTGTPPCEYARCPEPSKRADLRFECSNCSTIYCSTRCQIDDWIQTGWQKPHRELCQRSG